MKKEYEQPTIKPSEVANFEGIFAADSKFCCGQSGEHKCETIVVDMNGNPIKK